MSGFQSLIMSTVSPDGIPEASYAPYVLGTGNTVYVYVSQLAKHTNNLWESGLASILFIEPEQSADQAFARRRLMFEVEAELIDRDTPEWRAVIAEFAARFGHIMATLKKLEDFKLFRLRLRKGLYVQGFAKAYRISGPQLDQVSHMKGSREADER